MAGHDEIHERLLAVGEHFGLHVRTTDHHAAQRRLAAVATALADLPGSDEEPPRASPIAPVADGAVLRIDGLSVRTDVRRRLAEAIATSDPDATSGPEGSSDPEGADGTIAVVEVDGLADLDRARRAAVLRILPAPGAPIEPRWVDLASEWVFGDRAPDALVRLRVLGIEQEVRAAEAAGILHGAAAAGAWCDAVTGDPGARIRTASLSFGAAPHVALGAGGARIDDSGLLARFDLLADVLADLDARCAYACIDFEESFAGLGIGFGGTDWESHGGAGGNRVAGQFVDRYVPDAFPLQRLGPGHVAALGDAMASLAVIRTTDAGPVVALSAPVDWLPTSSVRDDVRSEAWQRIGPLLALDEHLSAPAGPPRPASVGTRRAPMDDIVLEAASHPRRGTRLTVLELAAWIGGDRHTDDPPSVSPVLRTLLRDLGLDLDHHDRQRLVGLAADAAGTGTDRARGATATADERRSWRIADWFARVAAPPWLRAAGLTEIADRLAGLPPTQVDGDLDRLLGLLDRVTATVSRRLALTTAVAEDRAPEVAEAAWAAWERIAGRTGWSAAGNAVAYGLPADVVYAADLAAFAHTRPDEDLDTTAPLPDVGASVAAAARAELGAVAWREAWAAADRHARSESTFSLVTTIGGSLQAARRADAGPDAAGDVALQVDEILDTADRVARAALAESITTNGGDDPWLAVRRAIAASGPAGAAYDAALDDCREVLGAVLFDDSVEVLAEHLRRWRDGAEARTRRVTVACLAREAIVAAARAIAARATAEALAADPSTGASGRTASEGTVSEGTAGDATVSAATVGGHDAADLAMVAGASLVSLADAMTDQVVALAGELCRLGAPADDGDASERPPVAAGQSASDART